jgi:phosphate/sulfate permease
MEDTLLSQSLIVTIALYSTFAVLMVAAAANDGAGAIAALCTHDGISLRAAQVIVAVLMVIGAVVIAVPVLTQTLIPLLALDAVRAAPFGGPSIVLSAAIPLVVATALKVPVPTSGLLGVAIIAVGLHRGASVQDLAAIGVVLFGALAIPLVAAVLAYGIGRLARQPAITHARPRDRLPLILPGLTALIICAAVLAAAGLGRVQASLVEALVAISAAMLVLAAIGAGWRYWRIRLAPFWVANDEAGFEAAHKSLCVAAGTLIALLVASVNVAVCMSLLVLLVGGSAPLGGAAGLSAPVIAGIILTLIGVLLFGHIVADRFAGDGLASSPSGVAVGGTASLFAVALAAAISGPLAPSSTVASALSGAQSNPKVPLRLMALAVAFLALGFILSFCLDLGLRLIIE